MINKLTIQLLEECDNKDIKIRQVDINETEEQGTALVDILNEEATLVYNKEIKNWEMII